MSAIPAPRLVQHDRIRHYLLNPDHPTGKSKAKFFGSLGFSAADPDQFALALDIRAVTRELVGERQDGYGIRREVRCCIDTPDGRNPCIVAIWFQPAGEAGHRLLTAYPG